MANDNNKNTSIYGIIELGDMPTEEASAIFDEIKKLLNSDKRVVNRGFHVGRPTKMTTFYDEKPILYVP